MAFNSETGKAAGKRGGQVTATRYGTEFFAQQGSKGGIKLKITRPPGYFAEIGSKGGKARAAKYANGEIEKAGRPKSDRKRGRPAGSKSKPKPITPSEITDILEGR